MADAVATQVLVNGTRNLVLKLTNVSDGTGESAVAKAALASYTGVTDFIIDKIHFTTQGMSVRLLWDADADVLAWTIPENESGTFDFTGFGGLWNNAGTGKTGSLLLTTIGHTSADTYSLILELRKKGV
jgi:hypothetical protein